MAKKELKINLTHNRMSEEAMERFIEKSLLLYNKIIEREKNEQREKNEKK